MGMRDANLALRYSDKVIALKKVVITYYGSPKKVRKSLRTYTG